MKPVCVGRIARAASGQVDAIHEWLRHQHPVEIVPISRAVAAVMTIEQNTRLGLPDRDIRNAAIHTRLCIAIKLDADCAAFKPQMGKRHITRADLDEVHQRVGPDHGALPGSGQRLAVAEHDGLRDQILTLRHKHRVMRGESLLNGDRIIGQPVTNRAKILDRDEITEFIVACARHRPRSHGCKVRGRHRPRKRNRHRVAVAIKTKRFVHPRRPVR